MATAQGGDGDAMSSAAAASASATADDVPRVPFRERSQSFDCGTVIGFDIGGTLSKIVVKEVGSCFGLSMLCLPDVMQ